MNELVETLLVRWRALAPRERLLVGAAAVLALLTLLQLGRHGIGGAIADLRADVAARREAVTIARLLVATPQQVVGREPVLAIADRTARSSGLGDALKRLSQDDDGRVRVRFEGAAFSTFVRWLGTVQQGSGARIEAVLLARGQAPGLVDVTLTLVAP